MKEALTYLSLNCYLVQLAVFFFVGVNNFYYIFFYSKMFIKNADLCEQGEGDMSMRT